MKTILFFCFYFLVNITIAQPNRWQQKVNYKMDIDMDVNTNQFKGTQLLKYTNNSPDTLKKLYYHLYFNAFQPNSSMDERSRRQGTIKVNGRSDWDGRVKDRIQNLKQNEIGYQKILSLKMNGVVQNYTIEETILMVNLSKPILPNQTVQLDMQFEAQVPLQVRRTGRDNPTTKVRYSMSQWYPKLCEYDYNGWHPNPYIAREFYGVWGDYEVNITIDKTYILGGTGNLQNGNTIGFGYEDNGVKVVNNTGEKNLWKFIAPNVHDFVWAADPNYKHIRVKATNGVDINVLYKKGENDEQWQNVANTAIKILPFIENNFGPYPYKQYSFIQGGDGGMEYPNATLIVSASIGTVIHEWMHTWYQMMLGTNESRFAWMDEGFAEYATNLVEAYNANSTEMQRYLDGMPINFASSNYDGYYALVKSGLEEPLTTHADHFNTNFSYSNAAYNKGCVFMSQLGYIIGEQNRDALLLEYYKQWRFKHPNDDDLIRLAEKVSGIELDWYKEYFINSTKTIDYKIDSLWQDGASTKIRISRVGQMPMPIDVLITTAQGKKEVHYIPLNLMYANKPNDYIGIARKEYPSWKWTHSTYIIETNTPLNKITKVEIDPTERMADIDRKNNKLELQW